MLLSSVNFVAKTRTGKSKDVFEKKTEKKDSNKSKTTESMCRMCRKELDDEDSVFKFPSSPTAGTKTQSNISGSTNNETKQMGSRVSIATGDDMCLSVDQFYYTIGLKEGSICDNTCIFRKKVLKTKEVPNGHKETAVFVLDCDQDFYITTNKQRDLELNYFAKTPNEETQDDRIFEIFFTDIGHCLIMPLHHKNAYLHHLDQSLSVQPFDLNWRCPEEYFFHFNAVPEPIVNKKKQRTRKICTHKQEQFNSAKTETTAMENRLLNITEVTTSESNTDTCLVAKPRPPTWSICNAMNSKLLEEMPERFYIELPTRKTCKNKKTLSNLLLGCFGGKSSRIAMGDACH